MEEFKARLALKNRVGSGARVEDIVDFLFPRKSEEERKGMVGILLSAGIRKGSDLRRKSFGYIHDELKLSERTCKVFLDRGLVNQGAPEQIMWYGRQSYCTKPDAKSVPPELNAIAGHALDAEKMREYARAVANKTWIQVAQEHMSEDEQIDALCSPAETEIIYAYRAMLRIISRVLPVNLVLVETNSFMGTLYLSTGSEAADPDWSRVVWVLQAKPPGMHYLEAMGRLVMSIQLMFESQPLRKFAVGVIGSADVLDIYMFWAEDLKLVDGKVVPVPRTVTNTMLSLCRIHTGVEVLMMFMCAPPRLLGFVSEEALEDGFSVHGEDGHGEQGFSGHGEERISKLKLGE